ncbi:MAG: Uma2 family endonuclease, partial [Gemmataceae bacterium]
PYCDGEPMADNMRQAEWMVHLWSNLDAILDCFVGMNNFWFPVEGEPELRLAPDVYAAFGRPKDRALDSYRQWAQGGTPVTVVFEILSPSNTDEEMEGKYAFYEEHGVEEYYVYDPKHDTLHVFIRRGTVFRRVWQADGFRSPRMGITFDLSSGPELIVRRPHGQPFVTVAEMDARLRAAETRANKVAAERDRAAEERDRAAEQRDRAAGERDRAAARLARALELGRKARRGVASVEELAELDGLEGQTP